MAVSPDGKMVALFSHDGLVRVLSSDLQKSYLEHQTPLSESPRQFVWCGSDAIALEHLNRVTIVGPFANTTEYGSFPFARSVC